MLFFFFVFFSGGGGCNRSRGGTFSSGNPPRSLNSRPRPLQKFLNSAKPFLHSGHIQSAIYLLWVTSVLWFVL